MYCEEPALKERSLDCVCCIEWMLAAATVIDYVAIFVAQYALEL